MLLRAILGQQLRMRRLAFGWTTTQLAAKTGTTQSTISKIERGEWSVSLDRLEPILDALGLTISITANDVLCCTDSHGEVHVSPSYEDLYRYLFAGGRKFVLSCDNDIVVTREYLLQYLEEYPPGMAMEIQQANDCRIKYSITRLAFKLK